MPDIEEATQAPLQGIQSPIQEPPAFANETDWIAWRKRMETGLALCALALCPEVREEDTVWADFPIAVENRRSDWRHARWNWFFGLIILALALWLADEHPGWIILLMIVWHLNETSVMYQVNLWLVHVPALAVVGKAGWILYTDVISRYI